MLNFSFDLSDTVSEFKLQKEEISSLTNYVLDRLVDEYMAKWEDIVNSSLNSTRDEYKKAMYSDRPDDNTAIVGLASRDSKLAMMIETGASAFDEKEGFEKSEKRTEKADGGWYLTIPFRHGTSEAIMNENIAGSNVTIYEFMKAGNTTKQSDLPAPHNEIQTHSVTLNTGAVITYKHKAPIYEGMHRRDISSTLKEKRGGYFTFRRVSDKSDEEAWIHPGFTANEFMDKALQEAQLDLTLDNAIEDWLQAKFE